LLITTPILKCVNASLFDSDSLMYGHRKISGGETTLKLDYVRQLKHEPGEAVYSFLSRLLI
jgi:hypothetical protein